jgi:HSP20 family protein
MTFAKTIVPKADRPLARGSGDGDAGRYAVAPHYEIKESDDALGLEVYLPGVTRDDLDLSVEGRELTLSARRSWQKPEDWTPVWTETGATVYRLHLMLPEGLEDDKIHAELKDGVLRLTLPKGEAAQRKKIQVE